MTDDLELRLRESFAAAKLPSAPPSLARTLVELSIEPEYAPRRQPRWALLGVLVGGLLLVGFTGTILLLGQGGAAGNAAPRGSPTTQPTSTRADSPSPSPDVLEGVPEYSVSGLQKAMAGPDRPTGRIALRGYWTDRTESHHCAFFEHSEANLEGYCHDGEYGITELDLPITFPGPSLTPWLPEDIKRTLFSLPFITRLQYPPIPIVVIGHVDDPRAADCNDSFRQICLDRFVVEQLVSFDPSSVVPRPRATDR